MLRDMFRSAFFLFVIASSVALAQEPEEDLGESYPCPLQGLQDGSVTVTSEGAVELLEGQKRLATTKIPDFYFNASKGEVTCKGAKISISSQMPFKATTSSVDLTWKARALQVGKPRSEDPSATALQAAEKALKDGDIDTAIEQLDNVFYPHNYYNANVMAVRILRRAHEVARQRYKARDAAGAAKVLQGGVEYFSNYSDPPEEQEHLPATELTAIRNDYGFFLAEAGRHAEAEKELRAVVASAPERAVARLNLADTLWAQDKKKEAEEQYLEYAQRIPRSKWPAMLAERCPRCASGK